MGAGVVDKLRGEAGREYRSQTKKSTVVIWRCVDSLLGQWGATGSRDEIILFFGVLSGCSVKTGEYI